MLRAAILALLAPHLAQLAQQRRFAFAQVMAQILCSGHGVLLAGHI